MSKEIFLIVNQFGASFNKIDGDGPEKSRTFEFPDDSGKLITDATITSIEAEISALAASNIANDSGTYGVTVADALDNMVTYFDLLSIQVPGINAGLNPNYTAATKYQAWFITAPGKVGGSLGKDVVTGDLLVCIETNGGGTEVAVGTSWQVIKVGVLTTAELKFGSLDGQGYALVAGSIFDIIVPYKCVMTGWTLLSQTRTDATDALSVDLWKCSYTQFDAGATHPVVGDSIMAGSPCIITAGAGNSKGYATGLTVSLEEGDILRAYINSCTNITYATLSIRVTR